MHYYREFTRFTRIEPGIYVAHIEPVCNIVGLTAYHFADRMPSEDWMLIDDRRRIAAVHRSDQPFYVIKLTKEEILRLQRTERISGYLYNPVAGIFSDHCDPGQRKSGLSENPFSAALP